VNSQFSSISQEFDMAAPSLSPHTPRFSSTTELQRLTLQTWGVAAGEHTLDGALSAIADVLLPYVPFTSVSIISFRDGQACFRGRHVSAAEALALTRAALNEPQSAAVADNVSVPLREKRSYESPDWQRRLFSEKPFSCPDLLAKPSWYEHEFALAAAGVRAYVSVPLISNGNVLGIAAFGRSKPHAFTSEELLILRATSLAIAAAAANIYKYEEMLARCDKLDNENRELRLRLARLGSTSKTTHPARDSESDGFAFLRDRMDDTEQVPVGAVALSTDIAARLSQEERKLIEATLMVTAGRVSGSKGAARRLGLPASSLEFRIRRLGINKFQYRRSSSD
jgi:GAF domain-containing protein